MRYCNIPNNLFTVFFLYHYHITNYITIYYQTYTTYKVNFINSIKFIEIYATVANLNAHIINFQCVIV